MLPTTLGKQLDSVVDSEIGPRQIHQERSKDNTNKGFPRGHFQFGDRTGWVQCPAGREVELFRTKVYWQCHEYTEDPAKLTATGTDFRNDVDSPVTKLNMLKGRLWGEKDVTTKDIPSPQIDSSLKHTIEEEK